MSIAVSLESPGPVPLGDRFLARFAVGVALVLTRRPPATIRRFLTRTSRGARPATAAQAWAARRAVVTVSTRCAGQGCLERSVAVALLCRVRGVWPAWCTGVRIEPFRAHAWVEADGEPVGEREEIRTYRKVMTVPCPSRRRNK